MFEKNLLKFSQYMSMHNKLVTTTLKIYIHQNKDRSQTIYLKKTLHETHQNQLKHSV